MRQFITAVLFAVLCGSLQAAAEASLQEELEDLKQAVVELNRDLFLLEEELLYPASTQVAVFLSLDVGEFFELDAVELQLNGDVVTNYLYTPREVDALHRGGVQRLHLGNLRSGEHEITAFFTGIGPQGREYKRGTTLRFEKNDRAKMLELRISDAGAKRQPEFSVVEWE